MEQAAFRQMLKNYLPYHERTGKKFEVGDFRGLRKDPGPSSLLVIGVFA